ncbi:threonine dehydratase, partial [archaeon D22]
MLKVEDIKEAKERINGVVKRTPLEYSERLSKIYEAEIYLKREDLQCVRSYKIRGAYNLISSLEKEKREKGIVCASAGNHAQGVALSCSTLKTKGVIYMPEQTPKQKVSKVRYFGGEFVEIRLIGRTFDECSSEAVNFCEENKMTYVPPFDDYKVMAGQGTVALEILEDLDDVDTCVVPIGGGGLVAGLSTYFKEVSPST